MPYTDSTTSDVVNAYNEIMSEYKAAISLMDAVDAIERMDVEASTEEPLVCKHCGAIVEDGEMVVAADGSVFCDEGCAEAEGYAKCDECGKWVPTDDCIETRYGTFCSADCAHSAGYEECEHCGEWAPTDDGCYANGDFFCSDECAEREGWHRCEHCGDWVHVDDAYGPDDGPWFCSESCAWNEDWRRCDRCEEWVYYESTYTVYSSQEELWCEWCADNYATRCAGCYELVDDNYIHGDYCEDCHNESQHLHEYGYNPGIRFFGGDGYVPKPPMFMGVELETDGGSDRYNYCDDLHAIEGFPERFWMTEDGSLENGVEITSQPMTLAHHIECMGIYEEIGEMARQYGFVSHDGGRCGLHVHVNRNWFGKSTALQDAGGYKVMRLMQRFEKQLMIFSRRRDDSWCHFKTSGDYTPKETKVKIHTAFGENEPGLFEKAACMKRERNHSQCLNFQHSNTYEFRIFRGTLKWTTYFACLGLVDGICRTAVAHGSTWVESVDWYTLIGEIVSRCSEKYAKTCLEEYLDAKGLR